jgi:cytochrome P450
MWNLADHPGHWEAVKADRARIPTVIEESLRLSSPVQGFPRTATRDVELGGVTITKGQKLIVTYASANRDEALFDDPEAFAPDREGLTDHVAFGKGPHYCLGANLARLELRVALEELSRRLDSYTLSEQNDFRYNESLFLRGLLALHLDIVPA